MKMHEVTYTNEDKRLDYLDCSIMEHYVNVFDEEGNIIELASPHVLPNGYSGNDVRAARRESASFFRNYMRDMNLSEVP